MSQHGSSDDLPPPSGREPFDEIAPASSSARSKLATTFRSLRHRNYRLYFLGQLVSLMGTWMQNTAVTWLAFEITKSSTWPAWISAAQVLPTLVLGAWGGILADRWPKRSLIVVTQTAFMFLALVLAVLVFAKAITPWQLLLLSIAAGIVQAIDLPARLAFVIDLAGREDLMTAVALNSLLFNVARALGPAAGGLLLGWKPWTCFLANALSYVAVIWALTRMTIEGTPHDGRREGGWRSLLEGFRYLAGHRELAFLLALIGTTALCSWPFMSLLPALAHDHLHAGEWGYSLLLSGMGMGAFVAAWMVATYGSVKLRRRFMTVGVGVNAAALAGLALANNLLLAIVCCAVVGFGLILFLSISQSIMQLTPPDHFRGRVMGIYAMVLSGAVPLGNLITGPAADRWEVPVVLLLQGLICGATALVLAGMYGRAKKRGQTNY
jgi:MFS family permease